jgi:hypothetical protein
MSLAFINLTLRTAPAFAYNVDAMIDPGDARIDVTIRIRAKDALHTGDELHFVLNKGMRVESFSGNMTCGLEFDPERPSSFRYAPTSAPFTIKVGQDTAADEGEFVVHYRGKVILDEWSANLISANWVELGLYSAWFPFPLDKTFTYRAMYRLPAEYACVGNGTVLRAEDGCFRIESGKETSDMILAAAPGLSEVPLSSGGTEVVLCHTGLSHEEVELVSRSVHSILASYEKWFGPAGNRSVFLLATERANGGGYSRPELVSMSMGSLGHADPNLFQFLAHELAHFYWRSAPATVWEDWLNESFAEYSSILCMMDNGMKDDADKMLTQRREKAPLLPPVWGLERGHPQAYQILYFKGSVILDDFSVHIGRENFLRICRLSFERHISETETLLDLIRTEIGGAQAEYLRTLLKEGVTQS